MKKIFLIVIIVVLFLFTFQINSFSYEETNETEELWNSVDETTKDYLYELGIDELNFEKLFELTPLRVMEFISKLILNKASSLSNKLIIVFVVLILSAITSTFLKKTNKLENVIDYVCVLIIFSFVMDSIGQLLSDAATCIKTSTIFIHTYLPVMTGIIIASKNPNLAITYNSFSLILSNIISFFADKLFMPIISILFSLNIISSFSSEDFQIRLLKTIRKIITIILSLFSTVFTGMLTTQSLLATSSDSIVIKGIRFASGTFIPIVGGNIGEAISSVMSSFLIMKTTLGIFIIFVIILINLPVMIELLVWYFFFSLCSIFSSLFYMKNITDILDGLASTVSLLNVILFFITFVLVISTAIVIVMGK